MFFEANDYKEYLALASELLESQDVAIWAYCLMPNHIHAVVVPADGNSLARFFAPLHRRYARITNTKYGWSGHLWQERFFSVAMDAEHTIAAMRYVELNPVRAGLTESPRRYRWSSARGNLGLSADALIDTCATRTVISNWREYLGEDEDLRQLDNLRKLTRVGRPGGSDSFVKSVEQETGRSVRKQKRPAGSADKK